MKVVHLNQSDGQGGAARAAFRIHEALCNSGMDSNMLVNVSSSGHPKVSGPVTRIGKGIARIRPIISSVLMETFLDLDRQCHRSPAILPSGRVHELNHSDAEILHLHWVQAEMLSVADIGRLDKPIVWTLHDMWPFLGSEHYSTDSRWRDGYQKSSQSRPSSVFDIDQWTWSRKKRHWQRKLQLVAPSQWLADCIHESALLGDWPVTVIPNAINTDRWRPLDQSFARDLFNLPQEVPLVMFGAVGGGLDPRKGFDLLKTGLGHLLADCPNIELVIFGQQPPAVPINLGFPTHYMGHLHDDASMQALYSAADVFVIPSRQDNLPNTGLESLSCGVPVVAFDTGGLPDVIAHEKTGYLAKAFDTDDLAAGIRWVLNRQEGRAQLKEQCRHEAIRRFSYNVVSTLYRDLYKEVRGHHAA
jgi:glycosyltransferase involved in cell wall biosynthesis